MKKIIFICFSFCLFFMSFLYKKDSRPDHWMAIHDNQYDCYNSREYFLTDSTIYISDYAEEGEMYDPNYKPAILLNRKLSLKTKLGFKNFMRDFPWDSLREIYKSGREMDCMKPLRQIYIELNWNGVKKKIQIEDCYSVKMAKVFDIVNTLMPQNKREELKINYWDTTFTCRK